MNEIKFRATIAPVANAISIDGATNNARIILDVPAEDVNAALQLLNMRNHNLEMTVLRKDEVKRYDTEGRVKPSIPEVDISEEESPRWYA